MNHISRHIEFDDPRYYQFSRSSGLPIGYFPRRERRTGPSVDRAVVWVCVVCGVVAWLV